MTNNSTAPRHVSVIVLLALAIAFTLIGSAIPTNAAASYTVKQCDGATGTGLDGWTWGSDGWYVLNQCPSALIITGYLNGTYTPAGNATWWRTPALPSNLSISGVSFTESSSMQSGTMQVARLCTNEVTPWCTSGGASWVLNSGGASARRSDIASGARYFQIISSCVSSPCPKQSWTNSYVRDIHLTMNDADSPGSQLDTAASGVKTADGAWTSGTKDVRVWSTDGTSGVERAELTFDNVANHALRNVQSAPCNRVSGGYSSFIPCPSGVAMNHTVDTTQLSEGSHTFQHTTFDASGNASTITRSFKVDNIDPREPEDIEVLTANEHGWQSINNFDIEWINSGETVETDSASGLARSCVDVNPAEGQTDNPVPHCIDGALDGQVDVQVPGDGKWNAETWTEDRAGNASSKAEVGLWLDSTVPERPPGNANGWIGLQDLIDGTDQFWSRPANYAAINSKICGYGFSITQIESDEAPASQSVQGDVLGVQIPPNTPEGINWAHFRPISCAGLLGPTESVAVKVDLTSPKMVVTGAPDSGWTNSPNQIRALATDKSPGSGLQPADPGQAVTEGASVRFEVDGLQVDEQRGGTGILDMTGMPEGRYEVNIKTFDVARNFDVRAFQYGIDKSPPTGAFAGSDPLDPTKFQVQVADGLSGVSSGEIQYAPLDENGNTGAFKPLATHFENGRLSGIFPDTKLPHGQYALRAVIDDLATNSGVVTRRIDGSPMIISNPLRARTGLQFSGNRASVVCKRKKARTKSGKRRANKQLRACKKRQARQKGTDVAVKSRYGRALMLYGQLTDANGHPIANEKIELFQQRLGDVPQLVGSATTDFAGRFAYKAPGSTSRRVIAYWGGSKTQQDVSSVVRIAVPAKVTLRISPRNVRGSQSFTFRGKVFAQDGVSAAGKLVQLQFFNHLRRRWQAGPALIRTSKTGTFKYRYRIKRGSPGREKIMFRAFVPAENSWAYDAGTSRTQTVIRRR